MDLKELDAILGSAEKRPVTETFSKKGNIVYTSYKCALESGRAKAILEAKPNLVRRIHSKDKFYPAIALNINVSYLATLKKELLLRNDLLVRSCRQNVHRYSHKVRLVHFRSCTSQDPHSCCHCKGKNCPGDPHCAEQIKAVKRLRSRTEQ